MDCIDACYIDFSYVFDTVSLPMLICKIVAFRMDGHYLGWLSDFLFNHSVRVRVNNAFQIQSSGVPQGSVLGPLCFLLFFNNIVDNVRQCSIKLYADNVKIYFEFAPLNWYGHCKLTLTQLLVGLVLGNYQFLFKSLIYCILLHIPCHVI
jgi:hypothetical protein